MENKTCIICVLERCDRELRTFLGGRMLLREIFLDWGSLTCNLVNSGRLNLANAWIPYWMCNAKIFNKPQKGGPGPPRPIPKSALDSESRKWKRSILHECVSGKNTYSQRSLAAQDKANLWSNYSRYFIAIFIFSRNWSRSVECLALRFSTVDVILAAKSSTAWFISFLVLCLKSPRKSNKNKNR